MKNQKQLQLLQLLINASEAALLNGPNRDLVREAANELASWIEKAELKVEEKKAEDKKTEEQK